MPRKRKLPPAASTAQSGTLVPVDEVWLWRNPEAMAALDHGLEQMARGDTIDLGSFKEKHTMRAKEYMVLERAVEEGVALGWTHAHKHVEHPAPERIQEQIAQDVLTAICEVFDFPETPLADD